MSHENGVPANHRPLALYAMLAIIFLIVVLATAIVVPGRVFVWIATYLIPVGVILGVVLWVFAPQITPVRMIVGHLRSGAQR